MFAFVSRVQGGTPQHLDLNSRCALSLQIAGFERPEVVFTQPTINPVPRAMKRLSVLVALLSLSLFAITLPAAPPPTLAIRAAGNGQIQLSWPADASGFALEQTDALSRSAVWQPLASPSSPAGNEFSVTLPTGAGNKFFRLRRQLTTVRASSPLNGEQGVAVTRETIVHFSAPLATNAIITTENFFAGFGGRRVLSRVELSSDRKKASLFYLEPLPGSARVAVVFDGSGVLDDAGVAVDGDGDGVPGGQAIIAFDTLNLTALANTAVVGKVFASELVPGNDTGANAVNQPLAGVTITVDGMEQTLRAVTDATGAFKLSPAPPGRFFVHIDGRTVTNLAANIRYPDRSYYPYVGKAWEAEAGRTNNLAGGTGTIYLPLIVQGTLQPVSMTTDTTISFPQNVVANNPALAGVSVTVPANSLFADDGRRGGKVGIAAVPPDRLPGPLPPGVEMPLVVTVQTDGALNFDKPAPICFPNLPNPTTGKPWPPGTKGSLISFNHKKGVWEDMGDMTVSADGKLFCTDPGVGIVQPGWHGPQCPVAAHSHPSGNDTCPDSQGDVAFNRCLLTAEDELQKCRDHADSIYDRELRICDLLKRNDVSFTLNSDRDCRNDASLNHCLRLFHCDKAFTNALEHCRKCFIPPVTHGRNPGIGRPIVLAGLDPVEGQINAIRSQISALILPFFSAGTEIPSDVLEQLGHLIEQANAVSGGDLVGYLDRKIIAQEEAVASLVRELGFQREALSPGNAPPYPVLYAARVERPTSVFTIRGETEPFGQLTLFLPPDGKLLHVSFYDPKTKQFGLIYPNLSPKARYALPSFDLFPLASGSVDLDKDGLPDVVEDIYGTDPRKADTDGDGIPDGAEIEQGTDPLGGLVAQTGLVGTVKTPGAALDVWTGNDFAITAEGASGVSVVNISAIRQPTIIAHIDTPGEALRVAASGNFVAVADGSAGLAVIDITDPVTARIVHQVNLPGAQAVAAGAGIAYVGTSSGRVAAVDLKHGVVLNQIAMTNAVQDVRLADDYLYVVATDRLNVLSLADGVLRVIGSTNAPSVPFLGINQRLFVGGGIAYTTHKNGYDTLNVAEPTKPELITFGKSTQFGWQQIVANGSGLGFAAVGPNSTLTGPQDASLYDVSNPRSNNVVVTAFPTPGAARAVSIYNGLGYVADDAAGLQVVNYLPYDSKGFAPTISLAMNFPTNGVEEGKLARVTAQVGDDVQVRNVEFYLDGTKAFTATAFPFEFRFATPRLAANKNSFRLRARAVDTGGNFTWTDDMVVTLLPDTTAPRITQHWPLSGAKTVQTITAYFDGEMNPTSLNTASFQLISAGNDGLLGTGDDAAVVGGNVSYDSDLKSASLNFASPLPDGLYRAMLTTAATDLAGNKLAADFVWQFHVADAVFWIRTTDGVWSDPLNWSTGEVPGPNDNVVIDVVPEDVTVTYVRKNTVVQIKSLLANERLVLNGDVWQVPGGIQINRDLTLNTATLVGTTLTARNGAKLVCVGNPGSTLDSVTLNGDLDITSFIARVFIRNELKLTGSILLGGGGGITFNGDQTLATGNVIFTGVGNGYFIVNNTLTLGSAAVMRGSIASVTGGGNFINQGLISADVDRGALRIDTAQFTNAGTTESKNGGLLTIAAKTWNNTGAINGSGSGDLNLSGAWSNTGAINANGVDVNLGGAFTLAQLGKFNRTGGTVNLAGLLNLTGNTLVLDATTGPWIINGGTIQGGTVTISGGAKLSTTGINGNTLDGVTLQGDLNVTGRIFIRNGLSLTGNVLLDVGGNLTFVGDQTFATGGIVFTSSVGYVVLDATTSLTLGPAAVLRGQSGAVQGGGKFINQGLIAADVARGTITISPVQFENTGQLAATASNSTLRITTKPFTNTGTIQELNGGKVVIVP